MPAFASRLVAGLAVGLTCLSLGVSRGQELLQNPSVLVDTEPAGWSLLETSSTLPSAMTNTAEQIGFAAYQGNLGLWLRGFQGQFFGNGMERASAVLSQTHPGVAGESYTFTGWGLHELNYSGGLTTLPPTSPLGAIPSPTQDYFELAFLDSSGAVIGTPNRIDLRLAQFPGGGWFQHELSDVAPPGTANVRVTSASIDMVPTGMNPQSAFVDTFSLRAASNPLVEILANSDLEEIPPPSAPGWTTTGIGGDSFPDFAARTGPSGWWAQAQLADLMPEDAALSQTVPGTPGLDYTFSGWSKFDTYYAGGLTVLDLGSPFGAVPSQTETFFVMEFLDGASNVLDSAVIDLRDEQMNDQTWRQSSITATAPNNTENIRLSVQAQSLMANIAPPGSGDFDVAYFDDFSLTVASNVLCDINGDTVCDTGDLRALYDDIAMATIGGPSDIDGSGTVDNADIDAWLADASLENGVNYLRGDTDLAGGVGGSDFTTLASNFGATGLPGAYWDQGNFDGNMGGAFSVGGADFTALASNFGSGSVVAVPEPATLTMVWILAFLGRFAFVRRR